MLALFPEEQIVMQSSEGAVTLTTHRICYEYKDWGRSYNQNIMLEHITSCENYYSSQIWLLVLGGIFLTIGLVLAANNNTAPFGITALIALVCAVVYWLTRRNFVIIASPSTKMIIKVTEMKRDQVLNFINKVEQTKNKRIVALNNRSN